MEQFIFAHRGASGYAPENTLEAFDLAVKQGAHGVELDVHLTRDGQLVVAHDETIDRCSTGDGLICQMTLKELKALKFNKTFPEYRTATIPTLEEVLQLLKPSGLYINVELKNSYIDYPGLEKKTIELAAKEDMLDHILFSSFNHFSLKRIKQMDESLYCGLLYEATLVTPWAYAVMLGMDAIHPHFSEVLFTKDECRLAHKADVQVNPWTVNSEEELRATIRAGADRIITNYPDRALKCLNANA